MLARTRKLASAASGPSVTTSVCIAVGGGAADHNPERPNSTNAQNGLHHLDPTGIPPLLGSAGEPPFSTECECGAE